MSVVNLIPIFPTLVYDIECEYLLNEVLKIFDRVEWNKDNPKVSKNHNVLSKNKNLVKKIEVIITIKSIIHTNCVLMNRSSKLIWVNCHSQIVIFFTTSYIVFSQYDGLQQLTGLLCVFVNAIQQI